MGHSNIATLVHLCGKPEDVGHSNVATLVHLYPLLVVGSLRMWDIAT